MESAPQHNFVSLIKEDKRDWLEGISYLFFAFIFIYLKVSLEKTGKLWQYLKS